MSFAANPITESAEAISPFPSPASSAIAHFVRPPKTHQVYLHAQDPSTDTGQAWLQRYDRVSNNTSAHIGEIAVRLHYPVYDGINKFELLYIFPHDTAAGCKIMTLIYKLVSRRGSLHICDELRG